LAVVAAGGAALFEAGGSPLLVYVAGEPVVGRADAVAKAATTACLAAVAAATTVIAVTAAGEDDARREYPCHHRGLPPLLLPPSSLCIEISMGFRNSTADCILRVVLIG
jgi:hypothetical protein